MEVATAIQSTHSPHTLYSLRWINSGLRSLASRSLSFARHDALLPPPVLHPILLDSTGTTTSMWKQLTILALVPPSIQVPIISPSPELNCRQEHSYLQVVNGTNIATYGIRSLTLDLGLRRSFRWTFIIANVKYPILGADTLQKFGLLVDIRHHHLSHSSTAELVYGSTL